MKRICESMMGAYPEEGCGLLVGEDRGGMRHVLHAALVENGAAHDRARRYEIPPERFLEEERRARAAGLEVVGFFHSHPGHPPEPSAFDRERAWPYYSYLIVGLGPGGVTEIRSWRMEAEGEALEPEPWSVEQDRAESRREQMK
jgi:proteasome lid subunit RPN8/RPN11